MTDTQRGVAIGLMCASWLYEPQGCLPANPNAIVRLAQIHHGTVKRFLSNFPFFFEPIEGLLAGNSPHSRRFLAESSPNLRRFLAVFAPNMANNGELLANAKLLCQAVSYWDIREKRVAASKARHAHAHAHAENLHLSPTPTPTPTPTPINTNTKDTSSPAAPQRDHQLLRIWQEERGPLPEVRELTPKRLSKCQVRIKSHVGAPEQFLSKFREAVRKAVRTPFLRGDGPRGWRVSFDWLIANNENLQKIIEGNYDSNGAIGGDQKWRPRSPEIVAGTGPNPEALGVRANPEALERIRRREEEREQKRRSEGS